MKLDKPRYTRVIVRSVVRADDSPRYHVTGNCRSKTEVLRYGGRPCWGVDKIFFTDTHGNNEDKKKRDPNTFFKPTDGQENAEVVLDGGDNAHQLRTLIPQKDTYPWKRSGIEGI